MVYLDIPSLSLIHRSCALYRSAVYPGGLKLSRLSPTLALLYVKVTPTPQATTIWNPHFSQRGAGHGTRVGDHHLSATSTEPISFAARDQMYPKVHESRMCPTASLVATPWPSFLSTLPTNQVLHLKSNVRARPYDNNYQHGEIIRMILDLFLTLRMSAMVVGLSSRPPISPNLDPRLQPLCALASSLNDSH